MKKTKRFKKTNTKTKVFQTPNVCYAFEKQGVQGCQIWQFLFGKLGIKILIHCGWRGGEVVVLRAPKMHTILSLSAALMRSSTIGKLDHFHFPFTKHHKIKSIFRTRGKSIPRTISFPIVQCTYRDGTIGLNRVATVQMNAYYSSMKLHNTFHVILCHEPTCSGSTCIYFLFLILSHQNQQKRQISSDKNTQI